MGLIRFIRSSSAAGGGTCVKCSIVLFFGGRSKKKIKIKEETALHTTGNRKHSSGAYSLLPVSAAVALSIEAPPLPSEWRHSNCEWNYQSIVKIDSSLSWCVLHGQRGGGGGGGEGGVTCFSLAFRMVVAEAADQISQEKMQHDGSCDGLTPRRRSGRRRVTSCSWYR